MRQQARETGIKGGQEDKGTEKIDSGMTSRKNVGWRDKGMKNKRQEQQPVESMHFDNRLLWSINSRECAVQKKYGYECVCVVFAY